MEANNTLGILLCQDNHLSVDTLVEIEYAMGRPRRSVRELVGQVSLAVWKHTAEHKNIAEHP